MYKILYITLILTISLNSKEFISDYFEIISSTNFPIKGKSSIDYIKKTSDNKVIFLINPKIEINSNYKIQIYHFDILRNAWNNYLIHLDKSDWIFDFDFIDNKLFILGQYYIYEFEIANNSITNKNSFKISNYDFFNIQCISKSKLLLFSNSITNKNHIEVAIWEKGKITKEYKEKEQLGIAFSLIQPRRNISYYKGKIAIADFIDYNIRILDTNFIQLYQIKNKPKKWTYDKDKFKDFVKYNSYKNYQRNPNFLYDYFSRNSTIEFVDFLNDSTLLIQYDIPNFNISENVMFAREKFHCIYNLTSSSPNLIYDSVRDFDFETNSIDKTYFLKFGIVNNIENGIVLISTIYPIAFNKKELLELKMKKVEYDRVIEDFYQNNDLYGSFYVLKWKGLD